MCLALINSGGSSVSRGDHLARVIIGGVSPVLDMQDRVTSNLTLLHSGVTAALTARMLTMAPFSCPTYRYGSLTGPPSCPFCPILGLVTSTPQQSEAPPFAFSQNISTFYLVYEVKVALFVGIH